MKNLPPRSTRAALLGAILLAFALAPSSRAAGAGVAELTARTNLIAEVVTTRKSTFDPAASRARNPFYPDAVRVTATSAADLRESSMSVFAKLSLRGIVSGRSAIINNRNFVKGDSGSVRLDNGPSVTIQVVEIFDDHVKITINGQGEAMTLYARGAAAR
jgi:hypothetical protein